MKVTYKNVSVDEALERLTYGYALWLHVRDSGQSWSAVPTHILTINAMSRTRPFRTEWAWWGQAAERVLEFGDCPSPHGWHNPEGISPEEALAQARERWGEYVDPSTVRLLTRDEIGIREATPQIKMWLKKIGAPRHHGSNTEYTYITTTPYGELPPVSHYAFPETARYGFSRTTGKEIETPKGYKLLEPTEVGTQVKCTRGVIVHTKAGRHYDWDAVDIKNVYYLEPWNIHLEYDAVFYRLPEKKSETLDVEVRVSRGGTLRMKDTARLRAGEEMEVRIRNNHQK